MCGRSDDAPPPYLAGEGCQRGCAVGGGADAAPLDAARYGEAQEAHFDRVRQAQQGGPARSPTRGAPHEPSIIVAGDIVGIVPPAADFATVARGGRPWIQIEWEGRRLLRDFGRVSGVRPLVTGVDTYLSCIAVAFLISVYR